MCLTAGGVYDETKLSVQIAKDVKYALTAECPEWFEWATRDIALAAL
jgi:hypothetical protein